MREATALWADALARGPSRASPAPFPWSLSCSVAGRVALEVSAEGPNLTLCGDADAVVACLSHAILDLAEGRVERALVLAVDEGGGPQPWPSGGMEAVVLGCIRARHELALVDGPGNPVRGSAVDALGSLRRQVASGRPGVLGTADEGWLEVRTEGGG